MEKAISILEDIINELRDETVGNLIMGRQQKYDNEKTKENLYKLKRSYVAMGNREGRKAKADLANLKKEVEADKSGETAKKQKIEALKDTIKHGDSKRAENEHANAQLNQGLRNKLEKIYNSKSGKPVVEALIAANISEECLEGVIDLILENMAET